VSIAKPPNPAVERTAGSHALAAAAHRDRSADREFFTCQDLGLRGFASNGAGGTTT